MSISGGIAMLEAGATAAALVAAVDLYEAKRLGRNRMSTGMGREFDALTV